MSLANINSLIGRHFVTKSNNTAEVQERLGPGGIRIMWVNKPTQEDIQEQNDWVSQVLGHDINITSFDAQGDSTREKERAAYKEFLRDK